MVPDILKKNDFLKAQYGKPLSEQDIRLSSQLLNMHYFKPYNDATHQDNIENGQILEQPNVNKSLLDFANDS